MRLLVSTVAPFGWAQLDKAGKPVEKGEFKEAAFLTTIPKKVTSVIGVAPSHAVTYHSVKIPTKKQANMLAAVPFALEDSLSEEIEDLHFSVMQWDPGDSAHVAVIAKNKLRQWVNTFADIGVKLDNIVPELSLLPVHPECDTTIIRQSGDAFLVKTDEYEGFLCDDDAFEYWWSDARNQQRKIGVNDQSFTAELRENGGNNVSHWAIGTSFENWLEHAPEIATKLPTMLTGEFEPEHLKPNSAWLNIAAGLAIGALILLGASHWFEVDKLQTRYNNNQEEIRALFESAFPNEEYLDRPRRQLASLLSISEDNPASEVFQYLLDITSVVVPQNRAEFEEINYRDEQLQIGVVADSFAALEQMTTQINEMENMQAALISSGKRDDKVVGQIKLARIPNG